MKIKYLIPALFVSLAAFGSYGAYTVFAKSPASGQPAIVQRIAQKFGLKEADAQSVFDDARKDRQTLMQTKLEDRLTQAVKDGKLTEAQKQLVLAKLNELQENRQKNLEKWKILTPQERRDAMQKEKQALLEWAKKNNIDTQYLFGFGMKGFGHMRGWMHSK